MGEPSIDIRLASLGNNFGPYAPLPNTDHAQRASSMLSEINKIEQLIKGGKSSSYENQLAGVIRFYCDWYVRGSERKKYLEMAISHWRRAIDIDGCVNAKIGLAYILIEEQQVRDLDLALKLVDEVKILGKLPAPMQSIVEKAKRWKGTPDVPKGNDFSDLTAAPAVLREERTKIRTLIIDAIKNKETAKATLLASRLYNLGLLAAYLYGEWDASKGVVGAIFDEASEKLRKVKSSFNFGYLGRISDAEFLSATDYKRIEPLLGSKTNIISVREIKSLL